MVDQIKHIFIVLVLPTKSVLKCCTQHIYKHGSLCSWGPG